LAREKGGAMDDDLKLKRTLEDLLQSQKLAVLATHKAGRPYTSLVAFASTEDLKQLIFATTRSTRKYANLIQDPRVALLIDNRSNQDSDIHAAAAVTATGEADEVPVAERKGLEHIYLAKHPHLKDFVSSPSCALIRIKANTYYLVRKFQHVLELHVKP
jgi:nitroimidazol reductase NimA-like FMN-containing flavoprotein (pyridoxamine 5'-phosphate oxidase superfamily)